jgi:aspartate kinase
VSEAIACKFGGSSVADAAQIGKLAAILEADARRRFVVVSAPGKRMKQDEKVTDLLLKCHSMASMHLDFRPTFEQVRERFCSISTDLGTGCIEADLDAVEHGLREGESVDWVASRGEHLHARLIASHLGARYVEAADLIHFDPDGRLDPRSYTLLGEALSGGGLFVIPGFYGAGPDGRVRTFSRGGSDVTGAIVARAVNAEVYENWTDVSGLLKADPRIVPDPAPIREVTYRELRELSYMGATVLHDEAVFPVRETGIPIQIRNTNEPSDEGTRIVATRKDSETIVGIAGRPGFSIITLEKAMMNQEHGFGRRVLEILEGHGMSYEHAPSSIDSMSVVLADEELEGREDEVLSDLRGTLQPDRLEVTRYLALIATVGQGMDHRVGVSGALFAALGAARVNVRLINQCASEISIIVGVASEDYPRAIRAIYDALANG